MGVTLAVVVVLFSVVAPGVEVNILLGVVFNSLSNANVVSGILLVLLCLSARVVLDIVSVVVVIMSDVVVGVILGVIITPGVVIYVLSGVVINSLSDASVLFVVGVIFVVGSGVVLCSVTAFGKGLVTTFVVFVEPVVLNLGSSVGLVTFFFCVLFDFDEKNFKDLQQIINMLFLKELYIKLVKKRKSVNFVKWILAVLT